MRARHAIPSWVILSAVVVTALLIFLPGPASQVEAVATRLLSPVQGGFSRLVEGAGDFVDTVRQAGELAAQNRAYRDEIERLESLTIQMRELELENRDLRELLGLRARAPLGSLVSANVIARDPLGVIQAVTVDRGWENGVTVNSPVITWRGVVGRVVEVYPTSSRVLFLTDVNSAVSIRIQDPASRATGLIRGSGDGRLLLQYVPRTDTLRTGDVALTSGIGGSFPSGLVVGRVVQVRQRDVEVFQEALVEPAVDMRNLERLYVLLRPAQDGAAPSEAT